MAVLLAQAASPALAEESLSRWAASFSTLETQHVILQRIYPDDLGPASSASTDPSQGTFLFSKGDTWVQLAKDDVWSPSAGADERPILIVTALVRRQRDQAPASATSYAFRDAGQSPIPITSGYAGRETLHLATLPRLGQTFVIVNSLLSDSQGSVKSEIVSVYQMNPHQSANPLRVVWTSNPAMLYFRLGFAVIHEGGVEDLLLKTDQRFLACRWNGDRFEADDSIFDSQFKALPAAVWQY